MENKKFKLGGLIVFDQVIQLVESVKDECLLVGKIDDEIIENMEKLLKITFPKSYRKFLKLYGSGIFAGIEIYGANNGPLGETTCVKNTMYFRKNENIPNECIVISDVGEYVYCLKSVKNYDDESKVYIWNSGSHSLTQTKYDDFASFLYSNILMLKDF